MYTFSDQGELSSWKEIAAYLGVSVRTAQLWEAQRGLPVRRLPGARRGHVRAVVAELDAWLASSKEAPPEAQQAAEPETSEPEEAPGEPVRRRRVWIAAGGVAACVLLAAGLAWRASGPLTIQELAPLTTDDTVEIHPALSPDTAKLAFVQIRDEQPAHLTIRKLTSGTNQDAGEVLPGTIARWSSNGTLAWFGPHPDGIQLHLLDASGQQRKELIVRGRDRQTEALNALALDWLDENRLVFSDRTAEGIFQLVSLDLRTGARQPLTAPTGVSGGDVQPAVREHWLAFARYRTMSEADIWAKDLRSGREQRLSVEPSRVDGLTWLAPGTVLASMIGSGYGVSLFALPLNGASRRLTTGASMLQFPHVVGRTLVIQQHDRDANVWTSAGTPHPVAASTLFEGSPAYRPDGSEIAFTSRRSGPTEIWVAGAKGVARQLTHLAQTLTDSPRWSPDGRLIAFTSHHDANRDVFLAVAATGEVRQFTDEPSEEGRPSFSADGQWIYFRSNRGGPAQIWRKPVAGGEARQVTRGGGFEAIEAPGGRRLFYIRDRAKPELWSVPVAGGDERMEIAGPSDSRWGVADDGVYYLNAGGIPATVLRWSPGMKAPAVAFTLPSNKPPLGGFSVTGDGRRYLWVQVDRHYGDILQAALQSGR